MEVKVPEQLQQFHKKYANSVEWRLTSEGVEIKGSGIERTKGNPITVTTIWEKYNKDINEYSKSYTVPVELIVATICTESGGNEKAVREEPGFISDEKTPHLVSPGLMQILISTARGSLGKRGIKVSEINRKWLLMAKNSINAGTSYIDDQRSVTQLDPVLVAAAYNAGGIYEQHGISNRFKLRQYPIGTSEHCDRWIKWFNDFWFVLKNHRIRPAMSFLEYF